MNRFFALLSISTFLFLPLLVQAHSWGTSYETEDNGYSLDIGYSSPAPEVGESVIFDFEILQDGERFEEFSDVWVRFEDELGTVLATGIHNADFGGSRLSYVFPRAGDFTVHVRFQNSDEAVAATSFPITVLSSSGVSTEKNNGFSSSGLVGVVIGLFLGFVATSLVRGRRI